MRLSKNVATYVFGPEAFNTLGAHLQARRKAAKSHVVFLVDEYFQGGHGRRTLPTIEGDLTLYISTKDEPSTDYIDELVTQVKNYSAAVPAAIIGFGGGITLDSAKAVSNLIANGGRAEDYQGWDLVRVPGVYKIGVPTLSGTGAEASRTCVMTNKRKNIKIGMNSEFSVYDHLILDPSLSATVPRDQYFYTGMDTYIHCVESLNGMYRHAMADSFSHQAINLCRDIFMSNDMQTDENREKIMTASYLGGASIANTYVGIVHPLSAGLSTVLGFHHCIANCIVMNAMQEFYPDETKEFQGFVKNQNIHIPTQVCKGLSDDDFKRLYESSVVHEKPLVNALGPNYRKILTPDRVRSLYEAM